jgi:hypothetical protein
MVLHRQQTEENIIIPMKDTQLLCTFSTKNDYRNIVASIKQLYVLSNNRLFIFSNEKNEDELFITYNITLSYNTNKLGSTISIHRKKQTNTLYTLNAMNRLIAEENNGVFDKSFQLNWDLYKNSLIITNEISVKIIPLKIFTIIS